MPDAPARSADVKRRVTPYRVAIVVILAGVAALWGYALTRQPQPPPDRLDDAAFAARAEEVCASNAAARDALPQAFQADDPLERADVVEQANAELDVMLTTLRADLPAADRDRSMLDEWLNDWSTYVENRRDYVERLRAEGDARIFVTEKDGRQITVAIDRFAEVNHMASCRTPKDIS
jgi:hypothetical protein